MIRDTILAIDKIDYPEHLKEILIVIRDEDDDADVEPRPVPARVVPLLALVEFRGGFSRGQGGVRPKEILLAPRGKQPKHAPAVRKH